MIYKILTRSNPSYKDLIEYILDETKNKTPEIFTHNLRSDANDIAGLTREFIENESFRRYRRGDQIYMSHEIIAFSDEDQEKITLELIQDMVQKYIQLRGIEGVYFGAVHRNTESVHVQLCVSGLKYRTGMSHHIDRDKLKKLKVDLQAYQKENYPQLYNSLPQHGRNKDYVTDRAWHAKHKEERNRQKEQIKNTITKCLTKAKTQKEFLKLLQHHNLQYYERNGIPTGIMIDNTKFRFSRMDINLEQLHSLPIDLTEEQRALKEIEQLRHARELHHKTTIER